MEALLIWGTAAILYAAFSLWYNAVRGPLTPGEVDGYMERLRSLSGAPGERLAPVRAFLEGDDGREFFMVNLIRLHDGHAKDPATGQLKPSRDVLSGYTRFFMAALFWRAGHPAFGGRAAGRYVEHWGTEADPGWSFAVAVRYRSRRDMIELATDPRFVPAHAYKIAAMASTLAFPVAPGYVLLGARTSCALVLALMAALTHLAFRVFSGV
jgi:hypothetical protein